jgi:hypothetical protein
MTTGYALTAYRCVRITSGHALTIKGSARTISGHALMNAECAIMKKPIPLNRIRLAVIGKQ